jgi:hypothetical protein
MFRVSQRAWAPGLGFQRLVAQLSLPATVEILLKSRRVLRPFAGAARKEQATVGTG